MPADDRPSSSADRLRRERWIAAALVAGLVLWRSAIFVFWPHSHFDSDQAVTGLMARHLSHLRAFPVFWYGQSYMLAVEAWLAAPLFRIFGGSVATLKLPLLGINLAIALLLIRTLERDVGLRPAAAALASLVFIVPAPITSALYLTANGGNVEPTLYMLLFWLARARPIWCGVILGVGFLNREFTIYGAVALLILDGVHRRLFTRDGLRRFGLTFGIAAAIWMLAQLAKQFSSAAGPGTSVADLGGPPNNLVQVLERLCTNPATIAAGLRKLFTIHWPQLFGLDVLKLSDFGIESGEWQGVRATGFLLAALAAIALIRVTVRLARDRGWRREYEFCAYLITVAGLSLAGYVFGRCGELDLYTMRYELLSVLGAVGLFAWYLRVETSAAVRTLWTVLLLAVVSIAAAAHVRLWREYLTSPPVTPKQRLIEQLEARRIHYGYADFWVAYYVTFMTNERVTLAATDAVRIRTYNRIVDAHRAVAVRVSRTPCGEQVTPAFWICAP
jgi:hypothetical protein